MLKNAKRICPTNKGKISISMQQINTQIKVDVVTMQDEEYPFKLSSKNPIVFMAYSLAKELQGYFEIVQKDNAWETTILLPIKYVMENRA
jgi:hypothetical protein